MRASEVAAFLRAEPPDPRGVFRLLHRHAEAFGWREVARVHSPEALADEVLSGWLDWAGRVEAAPGDLARAVDPDNRRTATFALVADGALVRLPEVGAWNRGSSCSRWLRETSPDWPTAWETCPSAEWMLWAARDLTMGARAGIARAAAACAARALPAVPATLRDLADRALDRARDGARGEDPRPLVAELRDAVRRVDDAARGTLPGSDERRAWQALQAMEYAAVSATQPWRAAAVARDVDRALSPVDDPLADGDGPETLALMAAMADDVRAVLPTAAVVDALVVLALSPAVPAG